MAARKKTRPKKTTRKKRARRSGALSRLEQELPATLREYATQVRRRLNQLEKQIEKAQVQPRRRAARLLREASHELGKLHARGEVGWRRIAAPYRRQLVALLTRLEKAVAPPRPRKARATRKKATQRRARPSATPEAAAPSPAPVSTTGGPAREA